MYGGGPYRLPLSHRPLMQVPRGGSSCANCRFVDVRRHACVEPHFVRWNGTGALPDLPLNQICSDWFEPAPGTLGR
jgi:hypothetical protein